MQPQHVAPIGTVLPHDYFMPGTSLMHGKIYFSTWAIAYWQGQQFRYERADLGQPWVRVSEYTPDQQEIIDHINSMCHYDMCVLWRFHPVGHFYFDSTKPYADVFKRRLFEHFGGFTPEISKEIGF